VILCDTGPIVALIDVRDADHARCVASLAGLANETLVTTWPCLTEAMHFARKAAGSTGQDKVWHFLTSGAMLLDQPPVSEWQRLHRLMRQYANFPMDLADASLVAAAERLGLRRIFTLDRDFHSYLINGRDSFDVVP